MPPRLSPSKELLEAPIWTTWARYFSRVSQAKVLKYAHEIVSRNLQVRCFLPAWVAPSNSLAWLESRLPYCICIRTVFGGSFSQRQSKYQERPFQLCLV